ncbi:MAG: hypothetical protein KKG99_09030 [Bacteroidetes bacterium]|nr:hypothetical protein [Bacteroidota bacterium]
MKKQNKMKCKKVHKLINPFLNGSMDVEKSGLFHSHLSECRSCEKLVREMSSTLSILDKQKRVIPDPFMHTRILQEIENRQSTNVLFNIRRILQPIMVAAILIIGIYIGIGLGNSYVSEGEEIASADNRTLVDEFLFNEMDYEPFEIFLIDK